MTKEEILDKILECLGISVTIFTILVLVVAISAIVIANEVNKIISQGISDFSSKDSRH